MHSLKTEELRHSHSFGQDRVKAGEHRTLIVVALTLVTMFVEIAAGIAYGSMALLADGLHMGSHAVALGIAAFAYRYARKHAHNESFSFGTGKVNALGGYTGAVLLAAFAIYIGIESVGRFIEPVPIVYDMAIAVAVVGLLVNGVSAWILGEEGHDHHQDYGHDHAHGHDEKHGHEHDHAHGHTDHNRRAAYFHVLADALTSVFAIIALLCAKYLDWQWMDPAMGIVGTILITRWSWGLVRDSSVVLLDRQSNGMSERISKIIKEGGSEARISDLHAWSIGPGIYAAIVTLVDHHPKDADYYRNLLQARLPGLVHVSLEIHRCGTN